MNILQVQSSNCTIVGTGNLEAVREGREIMGERTLSRLKEGKCSYLSLKWLIPLCSLQAPAGKRVPNETAENRETWRLHGTVMVYANKKLNPRVNNACLCQCSGSPHRCPASHQYIIVYFEQTCCRYSLIVPCSFQKKIH